MSAYVVDKPHIDALIRVALRGPSGFHGGGGRWPRPFRWYEVGPQADAATWPEVTPHELTEANASEVGMMLWAENVASIHGRYPDTLEGGTYPGPIDFDATDVATYRYPSGFGGPAPLTAGEAIMAVQGFTYQACEHPGWRLSSARAFCDALTDRLVGTLAEVREAARGNA